MPSLLFHLGPRLPNEMQNLLSSEKRTLNHQVRIWVQFFSSLAQVRCFSCFWFRNGLILRNPKACSPEDICARWAMLYSHYPKSTSCEGLTSSWANLPWQSSQAVVIPPASAPYHTSLPVKFSLTGFDTALCEQRPPSVTYLACGECQQLSSGQLWVQWASL